MHVRLLAASQLQPVLQHLFVHQLANQHLSAANQLQVAVVVKAFSLVSRLARLTSAVLQHLPAANQHLFVHQLQFAHQHLLVLQLANQHQFAASQLLAAVAAKASWLASKHAALQSAVLLSQPAANQHQHVHQLAKLLLLADAPQRLL
jgi:hypothetical protein